MEYILNNPWALWMIVGIFFLIVELATTALVSVWFVAAAVITAIVSLFVHELIWQIIIFLALSAVFMFIFKSTYKKHLKSEDDDLKPEVQMIGKTAVTAKETDGANGKVLAGDIYWRAVSEDGSVIANGKKVVITGVQNTTLVIKETN